MLRQYEKYGKFTTELHTREKIIMPWTGFVKPYYNMENAALTKKTLLNSIVKLEENEFDELVKLSERLLVKFEQSLSEQKMPLIKTKVMGNDVNVKDRHLWLNPDDLEFAKALQEENRLEAVKWLCEKAKPHTLTPLKDAKDILDAYR